MAKTSAPKTRDETVFKADKWLAAAVIFILVLFGGMYALRSTKKARPQPEAVATTEPAATATPAPAASEPALGDSPASQPGKMIGKARDVVAAHNQGEASPGVDQILEEPARSTPPKTAPAAVTPAPPRPEAATPATPDENAAPATEPPPPPPPSAAFRDFVSRMKVSGIFQGANARVLLNGRMYHVGDIVEDKLNVTLYKIGPDGKELIFRDTDGAIMSRRF